MRRRSGRRSSPLPIPRSRNSSTPTSSTSTTSGQMRSSMPRNARSSTGSTTVHRSPVRPSVRNTDARRTRDAACVHGRSAFGRSLATGGMRHHDRRRPTAGGGNQRRSESGRRDLLWSGEYDYRDFRYADTDEPNAERKRAILKDLLTRLGEEGLLADGVRIDDATALEIGRRPRIQESRLMNITEYGRAVHAEMSAITDAARRGVSVAGSTLFSTTTRCPRATASGRAPRA